jgi:mannose-6-phosphate isomerase
VRPIVLEPNPVRRFYRGGAAIAAFRGIGGWDDFAPEDWVGSTTAVSGDDRQGISRTADGRILREAIGEDPEGFLGPNHVRRFGPDPALLVKLLHAGERLPVHWHPDRTFSRLHLECPFGKTEAWVVVEASPQAAVRLGFRTDTDRSVIERWLEEQDTRSILSSLHRLPVRPGDTVLVPAGTPHSIGEGVLLVELQEPTDFSVLLEWKGFAIDGASQGHLGLGFDVALSSLDDSALAEEDLVRLRGGRERDGERPGVEVLFPPEADPFFRAERIRAGASIPAGFSIVVVVGGSGLLCGEGWPRVPLVRGTTVLVPYGAGECRTEGGAVLIRCMPPDAGGSP